MTETNLNLLGVSAKAILFTMAAATTAHADSTALSADSKPAWLTDASLTVKESYDDNVFDSGVKPQFLPASYAVPAGSVAALENKSSFVTTVSPKLGVNFSPLLGAQSPWQNLSFTYAPDFVTYHDYDSESYQAQRAIAGVKAKWEAFSICANDTFTFVNGSSFGPTYPGALYNANMNSTVRERREQIQDKATVALQYDWQKFFIRPTASLTYYDMMTDFENVTGYQNYVDRYDVNGGADIGYRLCPQTAVTIGYRYGHQYQQQFDFSPYSAPNDYQRILLGIEGKLFWSWLDVKFLGGPDFRSYASDTATHITPVNDHNPVKFYGEALITATLTERDTVTFKYKQWQWVSSIGKVPYYDSTFDLSYHRKVTDKLGFDLGGKILSSDYTVANLSTCRRNDWDYVVCAGANYDFNRHVSLNLAYALELGRNAQDAIANDSTREFEHNLLTLGATVKF